VKHLPAVHFYAIALIALFLGVHANAQVQAAWTTPFPAFHIAGNLYYVGSKDLASYLVVTPRGNILINSDMEANVPLIRHSIESLGFRFSDTKILLISHAHYDHCGGSAEIKRLTHARYEVLDADVPVVEAGGRNDFHYSADPSFYFTPTKVDHVLHDGDTVELGGVVLTAHKTAGHTMGDTTWTMDEIEGGRTLHVVINGSTSVNPGYKLVDNHTYPQIASDYQHSFDLLKALPCDIFLGAHGSQFGLIEKYAKLNSGEADAFIDPDGYKSFVADSEQSFREELNRQQGSKH
jgi:metallo-beta-lactamase class B